MEENNQQARHKKFFLSLFLHLLIASCIVAMAYGGWSLERFGTRGHRGARVYYDATHGARHLWNRDNLRYRSNYHTVSGFKRLCGALVEEGFKLHVENHECFNKNVLDKFDVFFIGEQTYHARFMTDDEQKILLQWVKDGGAVFVIAEHTDAHYMAEVINRLFKDLPVKVRTDSICDINQPGPVSPSWVDIPYIKEHPVTKGVSEYRFFNGASLDTQYGVLFSAESSWSDMYNPKDSPIHNGNEQLDPNELRGPLTAAAAFEYGRGRIVVLADHNALSNPTIYWGDHYLFVLNSMKWLAGVRINKDALFLVVGVLVALILFAVRIHCRFDKQITKVTAAISFAALLVFGAAFYLSIPKHYDLFVHTGNATAMKYMTKKAAGFFSFYGQLTKERQLRPWASKQLKPGYDALFLSAPTKKYSPAEIEIIDRYLARGKTVVYIATLASLRSDAGKQLMQKFAFKADIDSNYEQKLHRQPMDVNGPSEWTEGIFRCYIYRGTPPVKTEGLTPVVTLSSGGFHISEKQWLRRAYSCDLISYKQIGNGRFVLLAPAEVFNDRALGNLYENTDVAREQMAEIIIRLAKYACGDHSANKIE